MGLANSPDIFQEKMGDLFADLENARAYIDNLLVLTKGSWENHLANLDEVLTRLTKAGLKPQRHPTVKEKGRSNTKDC
eukprot:13759589-Ditylum_brightwellii.AAC.1